MRRYRQFLQFKKSLPRSSLQKMPKFPKKRLLGTRGQNDIEKRKKNLELWLQSTLGNRELLPQILEFLDIQEPYCSLVLGHQKCQLSPPEKCVAHFIRTLQKSEHERSKALDKLGYDFFSFDKPLSSQVYWLLFNQLIPLCGCVGIGPKALHIVRRLLSRDTYRYHGRALKEFLSLDIALIKDLSLDLHLLNAFSAGSADLAFELLTIIKDHFDSNSMSHMFSYILCYNNEALAVFNSWGNNPQIEYTPPTADPDWKEIVGAPGFHSRYRIANELVELEILCAIEAPVERIFQLLADKDQRRQWDCFLLDFNLSEDTNQSYNGYLVLPSNSAEIEIRIQCRKQLNLTSAWVKLNSEPNSPYFFKSVYQINALGVELKRSSSTDDLSEDSDDSLESSHSISHISLKKDTFVSQVRYTCLMNLMLAKNFTSELLGETTDIANSWKSLKYMAENAGDKPKLIKSRSNNMLDALERKNLHPNYFKKTK